MYLNYGLTFSSPVFFHEIFFGNSLAPLRKLTAIKNLKHYRRFYFTVDKLSIEHSYYLRYRTGEYFPLRLWVMTWSKWFIISFSFFKPIKSRSKKRLIQPSDRFAVSPNLSQSINNLNIKRFKLIFLFLKLNNITKNFKYAF